MTPVTTRTQEQQYVFKTEQFEGPLEVLLRLIEEQKLSINEVSLAQITDQFLHYLKGKEMFPLRQVAVFLAVAATLILIKSKALLPTLELSEEEKQSVVELEFRLKLYEQIRSRAAVFAARFDKTPLFTRTFALAYVDAGFVEPTGVTPAVLTASLAALIRILPFREALPETVVERVVSLEEKMRELEARMKKTLSLSFHELTRAGDKIDVIIGFLALLELIKQGLFSVEQRGVFDAIRISKTK